MPIRGHPSLMQNVNIFFFLSVRLFESNKKKKNQTAINLQNILQIIRISMGNTYSQFKIIQYVTMEKGI